MAVEFKHATLSTAGPYTPTGELGPDEWNADHSLSMASDALLGRTTAGAGAVEEISVGDGLALVTGSLSGAAGTVLQEVYFESTTTSTTTSITFVATSLTATITPKRANSVIECAVCIPIYDVYISSGTRAYVLAEQRVYNTTNAAVVVEASRYIQPSTTGVTTLYISESLVMLGRYTVNSTDARTFRLEHKVGLTDFTSEIYNKSQIILREIAQ